VSARELLRRTLRADRPHRGHHRMLILAKATCARCSTHTLRTTTGSVRTEHCSCARRARTLRPGSPRARRRGAWRGQYAHLRTAESRPAG
jgi:hypothetical protein